MTFKKGQIRLLAISGLALAAVASASACPFCKIRTTGLFIGETAVMGNGTVRSWVNIGEDKKPLSVGVTLSKLALTGLAGVGKDGMGPEFLVKFPEQVKSTAFNHVAIDWNPQGHEPDHIYTVPHFDFHFYLMQPTERSQITLEGDDLKKCQTPLPAGYFPDNYIQGPKTEIKYMGSHWVDVTSPEFAGKPFTSTMIYGSYGGKVNFIEPMVALSFLQTTEMFQAPIKNPKYVAKAAYYPTQYTISYNSTREEYTVSLDKFVWIAAPKISAALPVAKTAKR